MYRYAVEGCASMKKIYGSRDDDDDEVLQGKDTRSWRATWSDALMMCAYDIIRPTRKERKGEGWRRRRMDSSVAHDVIHPRAHGGFNFPTVMVMVHLYSYS